MLKNLFYTSSVFANSGFMQPGCNCWGVWGKKMPFGRVFSQKKMKKVQIFFVYGPWSGSQAGFLLALSRYQERIAVGEVVFSPSILGRTMIGKSRRQSGQLPTSTWTSIAQVTEALGQ